MIITDCANISLAVVFILRQPINVCENRLKSHCVTTIFILCTVCRYTTYFYYSKLSIRKPGSSSVLIISDLFKFTQSLNKSDIISTDEDPGLRIKSFVAIIKIRAGVSTKYKLYCCAM